MGWIKTHHNRVVRRVSKQTLDIPDLSPLPSSGPHGHEAWIHISERDWMKGEGALKHPALREGLRAMYMMDPPPNPDRWWWVFYHTVGYGGFQGVDWDNVEERVIDSRFQMLEID